MNVVLVGRHILDFGDEAITVSSQRNVTFPSTAQACIGVLDELMDEAQRLQARLLLQAVPAQVAAALLLIRLSSNQVKDQGDLDGAGKWVGFVVNKLGPRESGSAHTFSAPAHTAQALKAVALFANPNVKISIPFDEADGEETVTLTVDPPMKFVFSHIEWVKLGN
jgi:hypothetical protein